MPRIRLLVAVVAALASPASRGGDEVLLGASTALTGPAGDLGREMCRGIEAAIAEANASGGIHGRPVRLIALDDGYEPSRTAPNMRRLVAQEKVLAVIGNVGTPTAVAAIPIAEESGTPFVGAFTGAGVLRRNPPDRYVINYRASYEEETGAMVDALITKAGLAPEDVGFFTQRDAYGDAGFNGGLKALRRHGLADDGAIVHARYERNTLAVENAVADMLASEAPVRAIIMVGAYGPCAKFIRLARESGLDAIFLNVSFVGPSSLARDLGSQGDGVVVTQVVPPLDSDAPILAAYLGALEALEGAGARPSFGSLEGYIVSRMLFRALAGIEGEPTRDGVVAALEGLGRFDLGLGAPLQLGASEHQACHSIWVTTVRDGRVVSFSWDELASRVARSPE